MELAIELQLVEALEHQGILLVALGGRALLGTLCWRHALPLWRHWAQLGERHIGQRAVLDVLSDCQRDAT